MKLRRLAVLVVLIVAGFWFITTYGVPGVQELPRLAHRELPLLTHEVHLNHSVDLTEAEAQSSYDNVEQNNIARVQAGAARSGEHHFDGGSL